MRIWLCALLLCLLLHPLWATTAHPEKVNCPVCQTQFTVSVMMSSNNAGGMDRDFLEHAGGSQPVILEIGCCPKCHYANDVDSLLAKPKVPDDIKKFILSPEFHFPVFEKKRWGGDEEEYSARQVPAWAAYDARAQIRLRTGKATPIELTNLYIKAAWSVRLEENPFAEACAGLDDKSLESLSKLLSEPKERDNPSDVRIKMANELLEKIPTLTPPQDRVAAVWAAYTLRGHGENDVIAAAWPTIKPHFVDLEPAVQRSADLEKHYQALALQSLTEHLKKESKVNLVYLAAELQRRLGHFAEARQLFDQALTLKPGEGLKKWIEQQKARCGP